MAKKLERPLVIGGNEAYPLTTADQIIKADGSKLETESGINADNAEKLGGKSADYFASIEDVNNSISEINTTINTEISNKIPFSFGIDSNGNYGYIKAGADTVTPFRKVDLLWELPSGVTSFAAQTISLDLSKYKQIMIEFSGGRHLTGKIYPCYACLPVPMSSTDICAGGGYRSTDGKYWCYLRTITITTAGITFSAAYYCGGSNGNENVSGVPMRIYGLYFTDVANSNTYDKS